MKGGGGGGVIFGPRIFWGFRRETDKSVLIKLHGKKKKEIACSFNGISITCRLEMEYFFTQSDHAYVTQSSLKRLFPSSALSAPGSPRMRGT